MASIALTRTRTFCQKRLLYMTFNIFHGTIRFGRQKKVCCIMKIPVINKIICLTVQQHPTQQKCPQKKRKKNREKTRVYIQQTQDVHEINFHSKLFLHFMCLTLAFLLFLWSSVVPFYYVT